MSKSLRALGEQSRAKLFLAAYFWNDDESCISFTRNQGYGIIQPNGKDLTVKVMAVGMYIQIFKKNYICSELITQS